MEMNGGDICKGLCGHAKVGGMGLIGTDMSVLGRDE